jgi:RHH-type proline utilization regulon transcriptional repressor/proline dehydrogenase/delta 1-pyrroline-5-carboxylate dehydrogenase
MAEPVRKGLLNVAGRVRLYCPYGEVVPGMAYLVRRLLENTANESFLRQSFAEGTELDLLLEAPEASLERELAAQSARVAERSAGAQSLPPFVNESLIDFSFPANRAAFPQAIAKVRASAGREIPLFIGGKDVFTPESLPSVNPARPEEIIAKVCQAGKAEVDAAIGAARSVLTLWRRSPATERAAVLRRAADIARRRIFELSALQTLEVGKQWDQAYHDVAEGIDFLEYYAREMLRLAAPRRMGRAPGEVNRLFYQPKGVAAVISPWNFPFAIAIGMAGAAMVTGNTVVFKPASIASTIGYSLAEIFREAGLPHGVFNYCPGRSAVMGDHLIEHPDISLICFTGSMEVGLHIIEKAGRTGSDQTQVKRVIAEMGGKNAIIIDDDADLDEAVLQTLYSSFGFQGQKCSACSRVVVLDSIYKQFTERLVRAASSIRIGPAEDPANYMGPLADPSLAPNVLKYIALAEQEGHVLLKRADYPIEGAYVPLTIVEGITPEHRLAQEEVFGPVLAVMRAKDFDDALHLANSTRFALTGSVFSRSPAHLTKAEEEFNVGNLYLNKGSTGALVERQPFGGYKMSGVGSKTGGPDYLLQFMDPRCVTENTIRRGFTPIADDDDWF